MIAYFPLIAAGILILVAVYLALLRVFRPKFPFSWLVATLGALAAWLLLVVSKPAALTEFSLFPWKPESIFSTSPLLLFDQISWSFSLAVVTLALAVLLTGAARTTEANWLAWAASILLASLGIIAVMAGNPVTMAFAWLAIDVTELLIFLGYFLPSERREQVVVAFSARVAGVAALLWAEVMVQADGSSLTFLEIPANAGIFLLLAAGLRLGIFPVHQPLLQDIPLRRGLGTMMRMVPAAVSLVLLTRTAFAGVPQGMESTLLVLAVLAVTYAGLSWMSVTDELDGRPFWILGLASQAFVATIQNNPQAALLWGMATLLTGSLLFLSSARSTYLRIFPLVGLLSISGLPLMPLGMGFRHLGQLQNPILLIFLLAHTLFLWGYWRHARRTAEDFAGVERWVAALYAVGLALLLSVQFLVGWPYNMRWRSLADYWPGFLSAALAIIIIVGAKRLRPEQRDVLASYLFRASRTVRPLFSLTWMYRFLWWLYRTASKIIFWVSLVLEGEGGVLWALLLLVLMVALLAQVNIGV